MKRCTAILLSGLVLALAAVPRVEAETVATAGFTFQAGYSDIWQRKGFGKWNGNAVYGGGIILETMFNGTVGVYSGITFSNVQMEAEFNDDSSIYPIKGTVNFTTMEIPLCMQLSVNGNEWSMAFLAGITVSQILASHLSTNDAAVAEQDADILPYLNHTNIGATGGILFKIQVTDYTDFYLGCIGTFYFTDLFEKMGRSIAHPYDIRSVVGYVFRTGIFPPR